MSLTASEKIELQQKKIHTKVSSTNYATKKSHR